MEKFLTRDTWYGDQHSMMSRDFIVRETYTPDGRRHFMLSRVAGERERVLEWFGSMVEAMRAAEGMRTIAHSP